MAALLALLFTFTVLARAISEPTLITIKSDGLFPAGGAWDSMHNQFLLGSVTAGEVNAVSDTGVVELFFDDSTFGDPYGM